jgi:hypothetical protein
VFLLALMRGRKIIRPQERASTRGHFSGLDVFIKNISMRHLMNW